MEELKVRTNIEVAELLTTLETVRKNLYPEIPADIIRDIAKTEFENQDGIVNTLSDSFLSYIRILFPPPREKLQGTQIS